MLTRRSAMTVVAPSAALLLAAAQGAAQPIPNFSVTSVARSRQLVENVGIINSAFIFTPPNQGGRGVLKVGVNNAADWLVHVDTPSIFTDLDEAILSSSLPIKFGIFTPYIHEATAGYLSAPTPDHVATDFGQFSINNNSDAAFVFGLLPSDGADPMNDATSGVYRNRDAILLQEGQPVDLPGVAAGATWGRFAQGLTRVQSTDTNRVLVVSRIIEDTVERNAVVVMQTDAAGNVIGRTLVAKEGGPVGAGPDTWASISAAPHASAINNAGVVAFSGSTAAGVVGIRVNNQFVAIAGGATPMPGSTWGNLLGAPLDINNSNSYAFRAPTAPGDGVWHERAPDAGEQYDGQNGFDNVPADSTFGNGPLTRIEGVLSDDHDVDMYRVHITDYAAFSASTVPTSGFSGAGFDSVMYLIRTPGRGTGGVTRSDDAAPGVIQSTIGSINLPAASPPGSSDNDFYLAICTRKSRPTATQFNFATQQYASVPIWEEDPADIAVHGGLTYWTDPSAGAIRRANAAGEILTDLIVAGVPDQNRGSEMISPLGLLDAGVNSKLYWIDRQFGEVKIRRANLDGTGIEDVITGTVTPAFSATSLTIDSTHSRLYWSRMVYGEIYRANPDGSGAELMIKIPAVIVPPEQNDFAPTRLAVDPVANNVYWINPVANKIQRASATVPAASGAGVVQDIVTSANAADLAIDAAAGKLYWTDTAANIIKRANLDGSGAETFTVTSSPTAITIDAGTVYWSDTVDRRIRKSPTAAPAPTQVVDIGRDIGDNRADGPGYGNSFNGWLRRNPVTPGALSYQIRLTGATFRYAETMIVRNTTKIAGVGDTLPDITPNTLVRTGTEDGPVDINDQGNVLWYGSWSEPSASINVLGTGLFINGQRLVRNGNIPAGISDRIVFFYPGAYGFAFSDNGRYAIAALNTQEPPFNFTFQSDNALLFAFDEVKPACPCDWNQDTILNSQDFFDFLTVFFASNADYNHDGLTNSQDFFDFLTCFFAGCP